jgi:hypothetical protein
LSVIAEEKHDDGAALAGAEAISDDGSRKLSGGAKRRGLRPVPWQVQ